MRSRGPTSWTSAWPDALAFAAGLLIAWIGAWTATDLVWSLWLSSLVVGYATILWQVAHPAVAVARGVWSHPGELRVAVTGQGAAGSIAAGTMLLLGGVFTLAFFTVHFGFFHFVHSQFLSVFFPVGEDGVRQMADAATYLEVVRKYWTFLPVAFLAQRAAFAAPGGGDGTGDGTARGQGMNSAMIAPYRNVVRMHLLIFFFALASFAELDNFAVYTVVYAVYFFPWRLVRRY